MEGGEGVGPDKRGTTSAGNFQEAKPIKIDVHRIVRSECDFNNEGKHKMGVVRNQKIRNKWMTKRWSAVYLQMNG